MRPQTHVTPSPALQSGPIGPVRHHGGCSSATVGAGWGIFSQAFKVSGWTLTRGIGALLQHPKTSHRAGNGHTGQVPCPACSGPGSGAASLPHLLASLVPRASPHLGHPLCATPPHGYPAPRAPPCRRHPSSTLLAEFLFLRFPAAETQVQVPETLPK